MNAIHRFTQAANDGRVLSGIQRRVDLAREWKLRASLKQRNVLNDLLPAIHFHGDPAISVAGVTLKTSFEAAQQERSDLPLEIRDIEGMSGQKYRSFINKLVSLYPDPHYLEIGSWAGSTATAALFGNTAYALCIDNWSQFGGPRSEFFLNMNKVLSQKILFQFLEQDYRDVDYRSIGRFNIYLFDGPHEESDHYDGIVRVQPALQDRFVLIVDDWNWNAVRMGTFKGLKDARCEIEFSIEIRTTRHNLHAPICGKESDWHNGYFLASVRKR